MEDTENKNKEGRTYSRDILFVIIGAVIGSFFTISAQKYVFKFQQKKITYAEISGTGEALTDLFAEYALNTIKAHKKNNPTPSEEILLQQKKLRKEIDAERDKLLSLLAKVGLFFDDTNEIKEIINNLKNARSITVISHEVNQSFSQKSIYTSDGRKGTLTATGPKSATYTLDDGTQGEMVADDLIEKRGSSGFTVGKIHDFMSPQ